MPRRKPVGPQRDPAAVQAEIEQVQQRLAASIDELAERTHPKNVAKRGLAKVRHAGSQLVEEARAIASGIRCVARAAASWSRRREASWSAGRTRW